MKTKQLITALLACAMLTSGVLLTSCTGKSAYEIAVEHGFEGDEEEWLESLKGSDGNDGEDGSDGIDGEDGADGKDGTDGKVGQTTADSDASETGSYQTAVLSAVSIVCEFPASGYWSSASTSAGSGVIYQLDKENGDAYIITNYHVVYNTSSSRGSISDDISVFLYGMEYEDYAIPATYVGGSMNYDIAVLKVSANDILKNSNARAVTLADYDDLAVGQNAIAIGNADAQGISMTRGIVSVDSESLTMTALDNSGYITYRAIRIDTAINSGNSGGGLFNLSGELIGIVNAKTVENGIEGIAYAIPLSIAVGAAQNIIDHSSDADYTDGVCKYLLGISVMTTAVSTELDEDASAVLIRERVVIDAVNAGSLTDGVLKSGDVIRSITVKGKTYEATRSFVIVDAMLNARVGDTVSVTVERDGETYTHSFTVTEDDRTVYR